MPQQLRLRPTSYYDRAPVYLARIDAHPKPFRGGVPLPLSAHLARISAVSE